MKPCSQPGFKMDVRLTPTGCESSSKTRTRQTMDHDNPCKLQTSSIRAQQPYAVGPWEVLSRMPNTEIRFVGKEIAPIATEETLCFSALHTHWTRRHRLTLELRPAAGLLQANVDDDVLAWLRKAHETTTWTVSVCTGVLILGAAGILKGLPATTHCTR